MKPFEEQFTAWVDGKLSGAELAAFEKQLAEHPDATAEREDALKLGRLLREHPTVPRLSNPDFFNHQIMQRIAAETVRPAVAEKKRSFFGSIPGLAWAGAACLVVAGALYLTTIPGPGTPRPSSNYFAQIVESWPKAKNVSASTVYSPDDDVTVVWLDGLDYIPANYALK
jgi:anti-sigma factor RsiW